MLDKPQLFSAYVLSSPSVGWSKSEVQAGLEGLPPKLSKSGAKLKVLVTSAADEQPRSTALGFVFDPEDAMVDDATELAIQLGRSNPPYLAVTRTVFEGEDHETVTPASLSRTLRFVFTQAAPTKK